eukprot:6339496-Amphidinium_carterae.1
MPVLFWRYKRRRRRPPRSSAKRGDLANWSFAGRLTKTLSTSLFIQPEGCLSHFAAPFEPAHHSVYITLHLSTSQCLSTYHPSSD